MNKFLTVAALALALGAGAASAQQVIDETGQFRVTPAQPGRGAWQLAELQRRHAIGVGTTSAFSRNVGPGSAVTGNADGPFGAALAGLRGDPRAPSAASVSGGN